MTSLSVYTANILLTTLYAYHISVPSHVSISFETCLYNLPWFISLIKKRCCTTNRKTDYRLLTRRSMLPIHRTWSDISASFDERSLGEYKFSAELLPPPLPVNSTVYYNNKLDSYIIARWSTVYRLFPSLFRPVVWVITILSCPRYTAGRYA